MMKVMRLLHVCSLLVAGQLCSLALANSYDEEKAVERLAEMIARDRKEEREAAEKRERQKYGPHTSDDDIAGGIMAIGLAGVGIFLVLRWIWKSQALPEYHALTTYGAARPAPVVSPHVSRPLAARAKRYRRNPSYRPPATTSQQAFTELINEAVGKGVSFAELEHLFAQNWGIQFTIETGKLNITEDNLAKAVSMLPLLTATLSSQSVKSASESPLES